MSAPIQVLKVKALEQSGNLKAFVSVRVGALVIHGMRVVQQPGQRAWVAFPQNKVADKYFPIVECESDSLRDRIRDVVLEHWQSMQDFREHPGDAVP